MGKDKKEAQKYWVDYHLSFHLGFCNGPVDSVEAIWMKDRLLWQGSATGNTVIDVYQPDLFGGNEREGGAGGRIGFMLGGWNQLSTPELASRLGLTPENCPGFRGIFSLVFTGAPNTYPAGFWVSSNYPNVPNVRTRVRRASWTLGASNLAIIPNPLGRFDSNPAHMIHEVLVNNVWGMNGIPSQIDVNSFLQCAQTFFNEGLGLTMLWNGQSTIESFVQEILDHVNALFFYNPRTGLGTLKAIRKDYDVNTLPVIGPSEAKLLTYRRKLWGETINEIVVSFTNPETEETETLNYQDLGNIAMQGAVVSENRNYYGVRSPQLASQIAARDIVAASMPLASAQIELDRSHFTILPGDVIKLTWPDYDIEQVIMRVMDIDYGKPADAKMRLTLMEDVYGLNSATYIEVPRSEWQPPERDANGEAYDQLPVDFLAAPYPYLQNIGIPPEEEEFPGINIVAFSTPNSAQTDLISYDLNVPITDVAGTEGWGTRGPRTFVGRTIARGHPALPPMTPVLPLEVESIIAIGEVKGGPYPHVGAFGVLGIEEGDEGHELILFYEFIERTTDAQDKIVDIWRVKRAIYDTIPRAWGMTEVVIVTRDFFGLDGSRTPAENNQSYKLQPRTSLGLRDIDTVPVEITQHPPRPYLPFRPANCRIDGVLFERVDYTENWNPRAWEVHFTWSRRNRFSEEATFLYWNETPVPEEDNQFTVLRFNQALPPDLKETGLLSGDSYVLDVFQTGKMISFYPFFESRRGELNCLQAYVHYLTLYPKGWGSDWGYFWGGWGEDWEFLE